MWGVSLGRFGELKKLVLRCPWMSLDVLGQALAPSPNPYAKWLQATGWSPPTVGLSFILVVLCCFNVEFSIVFLKLGYQNGWLNRLNMDNPWNIPKQRPWMIWSNLWFWEKRLYQVSGGGGWQGEAWRFDLFGVPGSFASAHWSCQMFKSSSVHKETLGEIWGQFRSGTHLWHFSAQGKKVQKLSRC